ncbi:MAG: hypothetical protein IPO00_03480 [Betaproteobacteria bacterium]|nr:hypothetical protein [Betaproteobacteria bacterium]
MRWDNGGGGNYKLTKTTNIQVSETRVTADSGAGKLLAGGNLHLTGIVNNDKSEIMAGGNILLDMAGYTATSLQGKRRRAKPATPRSTTARSASGTSSVRTRTTAPPTAPTTTAPTHWPPLMWPLPK